MQSYYCVHFNFLTLFATMHHMIMPMALFAQDQSRCGYSVCVFYAIIIPTERTIMYQRKKTLSKEMLSASCEVEKGKEQALTQSISKKWVVWCPKTQKFLYEAQVDDKDEAKSEASEVPAAKRARLDAVAENESTVAADPTPGGAHAESDSTVKA